MKNFFVLCLMLQCSFLSAQWQQLDAPGVVGNVDLAESNGQLFAVTEFSLLYRSASNGVSWQPVNAPIPLVNYTHYSAMDADDNLVAVLLLSENNVMQVFQSPDFGATWTELQNLPSGFGSEQLYVHNGKVYYSTSNQLYHFNTGTSTWDLIPTFSTNYVKSFAFRNNQIWMSANMKMQYSTNLGATWQDVATPFNWAHSIASDGNGIVAATENFVFYSNDDGLNWQQRTLASNSNMNIISHGGTSYLTDYNQLFRSTDGFAGYSLILTGLGYVRDIYDINGFWVAGTSYGIYRSAQNTTDWQWVSSGISTPYSYVYGDEFNVAGGVLFYTKSQTAFSTDEGDSWQVTNGAHQFTDFLHHNATWYALDYNEIWRSNNLTDWTLQGTVQFDSAFVFWEYLGNTMVHCNIYSTSPVRFSNDDGATWQSNGSLPANAGQLFAYNNQLYVRIYGANKLMASADFGATWMEVGNNVFAVDPFITDFLVQPGKIYALSHQNLLVSTDAGLTWTARSLLSINPQQSYISGSIVFNGNIVLQPQNFGAGTLYLSQDDGQTWQSIMAGFTAIPRGELVTTGNYLFDLDEHSRPWRRNNFIINTAQYAGQVYQDQNNNSIFDLGELPLPNAVLQLTNSNEYTLSDPTGAFNFYVEAQSDVLTANFSAKHCAFNPPNYAVNTTNTQLNFGLYCPPGITDLAVNLVNSTVFRPGFDTDIFLTANHLGNDAANGTVTLTLDPAVQFISATPFAVPAGNTLTWSFNAFQSFDQMDFVVRVKTPASTALGTTLCHTAQIIPNVADQNSVDNTANLCQTVVGSYDPNDKQVSPETLSPNNVGAGEPLVYTVRFQNTGTYLASLVAIRDTLSPNLDPATLRVLNASHPFTWSLHGDGIVEFRFDGINLPDSTSDEPGSHGFVQFSVQPRSTLQLGAMADNTAYIYFDFNAPIITNTVTTTVVSTHEPILTIQLSAMPNPAHERVRILFPAQQTPGNLNLSLYDLAGRLVQTVKAENETVFDVRGLAAGTYFVRGYDKNRVFTTKFEVIH